MAIAEDSALCFLLNVDKLVASAQSGELKEEPRRQTHANVPRGPEPCCDTGPNALLRVQPHRHDLQRAGQRPGQSSRQLQNPRGR